eukprot:g15982.t1
MASTEQSETFDKYGLVPGNAILAEDKHQPLFKELAAKPDVLYVAGGATQNSIREPGKTAYMGCIGEDEFGKKLTDACKKDGVDCKYMIDKTTPTGACAVTIMNKERSLTTNLHAANNYKVDHLKANMATLSAAKIVYSAGFFITVSPESIEMASNEMLKTGGTYCLNLSAPFIVQVPPFRAVLEKTLPCCDYLFGNETEAQAYAEAVGWDTQDVEFIATRLSLVPMAGNKPYRKVVITQGADPTVVAIRGEVKKYPVIALPKDSERTEVVASQWIVLALPNGRFSEENILDPRLTHRPSVSSTNGLLPTCLAQRDPVEEKLVDTNGAGDAFVGGFLAALAKGKDMEACCKAGSYSASVVIQHSGAHGRSGQEFDIQIDMMDDLANINTEHEAENAFNSTEDENPLSQAAERLSQDAALSLQELPHLEAVEEAMAKVEHTTPAEDVLPAEDAVPKADIPPAEEVAPADDIAPVEDVEGVADMAPEDVAQVDDVAPMQGNTVEEEVAPTSESEHLLR